MYTLYKHENLLNGKVYIGISSKNPIIRWNEGDGYKSNPDFYSDIQKYGWDEGFTHEILLEGLDKHEALVKECEYILKYNSVNCGYNSKYSDKKVVLPENLLNEIKKQQEKNKEIKPRKYFTSKEFDFYNFASINKQEYKYTNGFNYFTRIPNKFIRCNLQRDYGLNRIFLIVYTLIDRNRTIENKSYISIGQVLSLCGYKPAKTRPKIFFEVIKTLLFLKNNYFVELKIDLNKISYNDLIEIRIIQENFDACENFTKLYGKDLDRIMSIDAKPTKESILLVFLYTSSYIGCRSKKDDGTEYENAKDNPEAFFKSLDSMAKELSMSKDTINQCVECLISNEEHPALLVRKNVGSIPATKSQPPKNVPNIYVLNKNGYQQEIKWALDKMLEVYGVKNFEQKKGN